MSDDYSTTYTNIYYIRNGDEYLIIIPVVTIGTPCIVDRNHGFFDSRSSFRRHVNIISKLYTQKHHRNYHSVIMNKI